MVSAYVADVSGVYNAGAVYLWVGGSGLSGAKAPTATFRDPNAASQTQLGDGAGTGVVFGDLDGDGVLDVIVCSPLIDLVGKTEVGVIYRWAGGSGLTGTPTPQMLQVPWAAAGDELGN